jgi:predicted transcriptional regulator
MEPENNDDHLRELVASVATAYFSNSQVSPSEVRRVIADIAGALGEVRSFAPIPRAEAIGAATTSEPPGQPEAEAAHGLTKRQIEASITPQALISFEDGKPYKTLRRHLRGLGLSEADYRAKWGLPHDYPMVAADYSRARSTMAKRIGLSERAADARRKRSTKAEEPEAKVGARSAAKTAKSRRTQSRGRRTPTEY